MFPHHPLEPATIAGHPTIRQQLQTRGLRRLFISLHSCQSMSGTKEEHELLTRLSTSRLGKTFRQHDVRHLGSEKERLALDSSLSTVFVTHDQTTKVCCYEAPALSDFYGRTKNDHYEWRYYLLTLFEDGHYVITWGHENVKTQSGEHLDSYPNSGDFELTLHAHHIRTREHEHRGCRALRLHSLEDSLLARKHYYAHGFPNEQVRRYVFNHFIVLFQLVALAILLGQELLF